MSVLARPPQRRHLMQVVHSLLLAGSERLVCDLALRLDRGSVRSSVCALALDRPAVDTLRRAAIPVHVVDCSPGRRWALIPRLYRLFRDQHVDVVLTHDIKPLIYSGLGARLAGARLVHVAHERGSLRLPKVRRRFRALAPLCHRIVVAGESMKEFLVRENGLPSSKVGVIPTGVDVAQFSPQSHLTRETLGFSAQERLVGHVGRLEPEKDHDTLLRAFRITLAAYPNARLIIVGDGTLRSDLQNAARSLGIAGRVDFLGFRTDVADLLPLFDVFVVSSRSDGLPLPILEAMACARPVVATAVGDIPSLVRTGVTGVIVPPCDAIALATALTVLLECPQLAERMGRAGRRLIEEHHSFAQVVGRYQDLYSSL